MVAGRSECRSDDEQQIDMPFANLRKEHRQAQNDQDGEHPGLKILPTAQEMIPGPNVLGQWSSEHRNRGEHQQESPDCHRPLEDKDQIRTARIENILQEFAPFRVWVLLGLQQEPSTPIKG